MSVLDWLFDSKKTTPVSQPTVTVGMDSDAWLDEMLEVIEQKESRRKKRKKRGDPWACYDD